MGYLKSYSTVINESKVRYALAAALVLQCGTWTDNMAKLQSVVRQLQSAGHGVYLSVLTAKQMRQHVAQAITHKIQIENAKNKGKRTTSVDAMIKKSLEYVM